MRAHPLRQFVFKTSYDKANRLRLTSTWSWNGRRANILSEIRKTFGCPVITDVRRQPLQASAEVVDIIKSAFLSRQTDLLLFAGNTGKPINIKKGQFLAPWEMQNVAEKIANLQ